MIWRFTILHGAEETEIDNPPGWDSMTKTISRDRETHGVIFSFSQSNLSFIEEAYWIIKEEYLLHGTDGDVGLRIDWLCDNCEGYQPFYLGKLDFKSYSEKCADDCSISIGLEASQAEILIKNRMDTAVDLTSNKAYDGSTLLADYPALGKEIFIPSKALLLKAEATCTAIEGDDGYHILGDADYVRSQSAIQDKFIISKFNNTVLSELEGFTPSPQIDYVANYDDNPIFTAASLGTMDPGGSTYHVDYRIKGKIYVKWRAGGIGNTASNVRVEISKAFFYGRAKRDVFSDKLVLTYSQGNALGEHDVHEHEIPFDWAWAGDLQLETGEKMWSVIPMRTQWSGPSSPFLDISVRWDDDASYFKIRNKSVTLPTPADVYLLHEAASRVFEHITNNQYKFKSSYYGRTDSLPYSFPANGCGGMRALTNGLQIRRAKLPDGTKPKVFLSPKDLFDSCNAVDCIGMGIENDNVVFEPIDYFYSNDIIFVADGVNEITTTIRVDKIWVQFTFGYQRFETESANGLDAIHTKRQYRLPLKNADGKLEKLSKMIADGYVIEATRRKFGTSEDWRYDQDIFILCLGNQLSQPYTITATGDFLFTSFYTKTGDLSKIAAGDKVTIASGGLNNGTFTVESVSNFGGGPEWAVYFIEPIQQQAGQTVSITLVEPGYTVEVNNIVDPGNMFDPSTVINYAITPIRNAMRWFKWLVQGVRDYGSAKVLFNSGEGNYVAKGLLATGCANEAGPIAENDPLQLPAFADVDLAKPFTLPEKDSFKFPMGLNEFVDIAAKKYGKIKYRRNKQDEWKYGWIDTLKYNPNEGEAEFDLITCK